MRASRSWFSLFWLLLILSTISFIVFINSTTSFSYSISFWALKSEQQFRALSYLRYNCYQLVYLLHGLLRDYSLLSYLTIQRSKLQIDRSFIELFESSAILSRSIETPITIASFCILKTTTRALILLSKQTTCQAHYRRMLLYYN